MSLSNLLRNRVDKNQRYRGVTIRSHGFMNAIAGLLGFHDITIRSICTKTITNTLKVVGKLTYSHIQCQNPSRKRSESTSDSTALILDRETGSLSLIKDSSTSPRSRLAISSSKYTADAPGESSVTITGSNDETITAVGSRLHSMSEYGLKNGGNRPTPDSASSTYLYPDLTHQLEGAWLSPPPGRPAGLNQRTTRSVSDSIIITSASKVTNSDLGNPNDGEASQRPPIRQSASSPASRRRSQSANALNEVIAIDGVVRDLLLDPTRHKDPEETGYIYVAASPEKPGRVKIGQTNKESVIRKRKIESDCKLELDLMHSTPFRIKHFKRVENIVHAELQQFQRKWRCDNHSGGHTREHKEWFELDEDTAYSVIERWAAFAVQDPWTEADELKTFWTDKLEELRLPETANTYQDHVARHDYWQSFIAPSHWSRLCYVVRSYCCYVDPVLSHRWRSGYVFAAFYSVWWSPGSVSLLMLLTACFAMGCMYMEVQRPLARNVRAKDRRSSNN